MTPPPPDRALSGEAPAFWAVSLVLAILVVQALAHGMLTFLGPLLWGYVLALVTAVGSVLCASAVRSPAEDGSSGVAGWLERRQKGRTDGWGGRVSATVSEDGCRVGSGRLLSWAHFESARLVNRSGGPAILLRLAGAPRRDFILFAVGIPILVPAVLGAALQLGGAWLGFRWYGARYDVLAAATAGVHTLGTCILVLFYVGRKSRARRYHVDLDIKLTDTGCPPETALTIVRSFLPGA